MTLINILYGSSCVGKSTHMLNSSDEFFKVEMDTDNATVYDKFYEAFNINENTKLYKQMHKNA